MRMCRVLVKYRREIWGVISRSVNGENVLGGVAYKNKITSFLTFRKWYRDEILVVCYR